MDKALQLSAEFGGLELYVPHNIRDDHVLVRVLGRRAADKLAKHYGGDRIDIPFARSWNLQERNRAIIKAAEAGKSRNALARMHRMHARSVRRIVNSEADLDSRQADLFDE